MHFRKAYLAAAVGAAFSSLPLAASAQATAKPAPALEVKVSGQINRSIMRVDDGTQDGNFHVDNSLSGTRIRFAGTARISQTLQAGAVIEAAFQSNASDVVTFAAKTAAPAFVERHIDLFFDTSFGRFSLGQGSGAADGAVETDLSGTGVAQGPGVADLGGAVLFRTTAGAAGPSIATTLTQQDFESRYDRLRYDSPSFNGFGIAASWGDKGTTVHELALRYNGDLGNAGKIGAALGYSDEDTAVPGTVDDKVIGGSVSWAAKNGLSLTYGHTSRDRTATREGKFDYFKVGYAFGQHAISGDYGKGREQGAVGERSTMYGLAYVFKPIGWAEIYAAGKRHKLTRPGTSYHNIDVLMVGTRVRF